MATVAEVVMPPKEACEMTINLTELAAKRAKMTPGEYVLPRGSSCIYGGPDANLEIAVFSDEAVNFDGDGPGLVATHNAADVLIEVVSTLIAYNAAKSEAARLQEEASRNHGLDAYKRYDVADQKRAACKAAHAQALAKVAL